MQTDRHQVLLDSAVTARRGHNSAHASAIAAAATFYDSRTAEFDLDSIARPLDAERIAHSSTINELASAFTTTAGAVETALTVWWGSRPAYQELFTDGLITFEILQTIRDHTLGASSEILARLETDIITATRHFERNRLGREIDRMITTLDPDFDARARKRAHSTTRKVRVTPLPRGMARMSAVVGARDAAELAALIDTECTRLCGLDPRTLDTRRSDAFTALMRGGHLTCLCGYPNCLIPEPTADTDTDSSDDDNGSGGGSDNGSGGGSDNDGGGGSDNDDGGGGGGNDNDGGDPQDRGPQDRGPDGNPAVHPTPRGDNTPALAGTTIADSIRYPHGATTPPATPLIHITADLETVLGLHNRSAYLHGYGPLDPTTLREMATDATWQIIFTTSRKYLDTLTDFDPQPHPPPRHTPIHHTPHCTCTCGEQPRPQSHSHPTTTGTGAGAGAGAGTAGTLADLLHRAATEHNHHATTIPTRMTTPTPDQREDDRRRSNLPNPNPGPDSERQTPNPDPTNRNTNRDTDSDPDTGTDTDTDLDSDLDETTYDPDTLAATTAPDPVSTTPDIVLGRTTTLPAGHLPTRNTPPPHTAPPHIPPRPTPAALAEHYRNLVADDPTHAHAEHPDGHGGHPTPPPGALTYTPSAALALYIRAQHPTCRHPGCNVPSSRCDLDHIVEFDHHNPQQGGWTIAANLGPYCRTHHNLKTSKLWNTETLAYNVIHTTDPHGNHYFSPPEL